MRCLYPYDIHGPCAHHPQRTIYLYKVSRRSKSQESTNHTNAEDPSDSLRKLLRLDKVIRVVHQNVCKRLRVRDEDSFSVELCFVPDHAVVRDGVDPFAHWVTGGLGTDLLEVAVPEGGTLEM